MQISATELFNLIHRAAPEPLRSWMEVRSQVLVQVLANLLGPKPSAADALLATLTPWQVDRSLTPPVRISAFGKAQNAVMLDLARVIEAYGPLPLFGVAPLSSVHMARQVLPKDLHIYALAREQPALISLIRGGWISVTEHPQPGEAPLLETFPHLLEGAGEVQNRRWYTLMPSDKYLEAAGLLVQAEAGADEAFQELDRISKQKPEIFRYSIDPDWSPARSPRTAARLTGLVSGDPSRYAINAVLWDDMPEASGSALVGTDGNILGRIRLLDIERPAYWRELDLLRVWVSKGRAEPWIKAPLTLDTLLSAPKISAEYPDYRQVLPGSMWSPILVLHPKILKEFLWQPGLRDRSGPPRHSVLAPSMFTEEGIHLRCFDFGVNSLLKGRWVSSNGYPLNKSSVNDPPFSAPIGFDAALLAAILQACDLNSPLYLQVGRGVLDPICLWQSALGIPDGSGAPVMDSDPLYLFVLMPLRLGT